VKQTRNDFQFQWELIYGGTNLQNSSNWRNSYNTNSVQQISIRDSKICVGYGDSTGFYFEKILMKNYGMGSSNKSPLLLLQQCGQWKI